MSDANNKIDKKTVVNECLQGLKKGTLITGKHDPKKLITTFPSYRSVISFEFTADNAAELKKYLKSNEYNFIKYDNTIGNILYEFYPNPTSTFTVTGSGVPANSPVPTEVHDTFIVVRGKKQGYHMYTDNHERLKKEDTKGRNRRK